MTRRLNLRAFRKNEDGLAAIEFALVLPLLVTIFLGSIAAFDVYRTAEELEASSGVIADVISRQVTTDNGELNQVSDLFVALTGAQSRARAEIRIRSVLGELDDKGTPTPNDDEIRYKVEWEFDSVNGGTQDVDSYITAAEVIPLSPGQSALLVDTLVKDTATFDYFGFGEQDFENSMQLSPRFTSRIVNSDYGGN